MGHRKLINGGSAWELNAPIDLIIHTKAPSKWKLIDMETGQEYIGTAKPNKYGCWVRVKDKDMGILDNLESSMENKGWEELLDKIDKGEITKENIPGYMQTPPDWCDDCTVQDSVCTICGCSHNC